MDQPHQVTPGTLEPSADAVPTEAGTSAPRVASDSAGSGKLVAALIAVAALAVVVYFAAGMPGMDHGQGSTSMDMTSGGKVAADDFADLMSTPGRVLLNVHTPYDGEIEETDLFVPFDQLTSALLPADRMTTLLVYCRTGHMSKIASATLRANGYVHVIELDGGLDAWSASGREVVVRPKD